MAFILGQIYGSTESRNILIHVQSTDLKQRYHGNWMGKEQSSTNDIRTNGHVMKRNKTLNLYLTLYTKIESKWIIELYERDKTIKFVQGKIGKIFVTLD